MEALVVKVSDSLILKILTPKQMHQQLLVGFAQVKAGNTAEKLLDRIREIIHFLHRAKQITKKVHSNTGWARKNAPKIN